MRPIRPIPDLPTVYCLLLLPTASCSCLLPPAPASCSSFHPAVGAGRSLFDIIWSEPALFVDRAL